MSSNSEPDENLGGNVPCDVLGILREHDVPCNAINRIPFEGRCLTFACAPDDKKGPPRTGKE